MALNPRREVLGQAASQAFPEASPFRGEAEAALTVFRAQRAALEREVNRGNLTAKVARERAADAATQLRQELLSKSAGFSPTPRWFLDRLVQVSEARKASRNGLSLESLQQETNRLLRQNLIEQQLANRAVEFEGRTFVRPITGGQPAPTLDGLIAFHQHAEQAGDEPAREWARRQLEGMRPHVLNEVDQWRIDQICDRPDRVNPRVVDRYLNILREFDEEAREVFVQKALEERDAGACCAAFLLAREVPDGLSLSWVRMVLDRLKDLPDAAINHLRAWEADARKRDAEAARLVAEHAAALAENEARLPGLEVPDPQTLDRRFHVEALPIASLGEPIGLTLERRGYTSEEFETLRSETTSTQQ